MLGSAIYAYLTLTRLNRRWQHVVSKRIADWQLELCNKRRRERGAHTCTSQSELEVWRRYLILIDVICVLQEIICRVRYGNRDWTLPQCAIPRLCLFNLQRRPRRSSTMQRRTHLLSRMHYELDYRRQSVVSTMRRRPQSTNSTAIKTSGQSCLVDDPRTQHQLWQSAIWMQACDEVRTVKWSSKWLPICSV